MLRNDLIESEEAIEKEKQKNKKLEAELMIRKRQIEYFKQKERFEKMVLEMKEPIEVLKRQAFALNEAASKLEKEKQKLNENEIE